jgi:4-amino-4-deoxychorismate lyase
MTPESRPLAVAVLGRGVIDPQSPVIHADDPGLLRGLAAFETLRVYGGRPFALHEHLARLARSTERMGLGLPGITELETLATDAIEAAGVADCSLRFTVTGGPAGSGPVAMALIAAIPSELEAVRARGINVITLQLGTDPRARIDAPWLLDGVKSTSYAVNMAARDEALRRGADDAVFLAADGTVLEGPTTNVWWRRGETLYTPALDLGILAGVTRAWIMRLADELGYEVEDGWYPRTEMAAADEVLTSSSVRELMPVTGLDGKAVGDGRPGPAATALQTGLRHAAEA